jgi:hypothetical protein
MANVQKIVEDLSKLTVLEAAELAEMLRQRWSAGDGSEKLFEDRQRTRMDPLGRGEELFEFYDTCGRHGYDEFRSIVNAWLAEMPMEARAELITRMRDGGNREFQSALCELVVHAFLVRSGYKVVLHPDVPGSTKHPDLAATDQEGNVVAYVEVTTVNPPDKQAAELNRENPVYNAIDAAKLPAGCCLGYRLVRAGKSSPPLRTLVADIERWVRENEEAAKVGEVSRRFKSGDWEIELDLYAGGSNPEPTSNAIGAADMRGGVITPHQDLRGALDEKSDRYGKPSVPYLIVVADAKDQFFGKDSTKLAITDAVLGDEIVKVQEGGKAQMARAKNGFWHGARGPRKQHVSGVLLLPGTGLWKLREEKGQPILAVNPWADHSLPEGLKTLTRFEAKDDQWVLHVGKLFADILGMPKPWPPVEDS